MKNREIVFPGINPSQPAWEIPMGQSKQQQAMRVAVMVGLSIAEGDILRPDGRSVETLAILAVNQTVGTFDPGFRKDLRMMARDAFNRTVRFKNSGD